MSGTGGGFPKYKNIEDMQRKIRETEKETTDVAFEAKVSAEIIKLLADYNLEWQEVERRVVLSDDWQKTLKDF